MASNLNMPRARALVRLAAVVGVVLGVAILLLYGWANRTGRYQVQQLDATSFVVLDTATGAHWVYFGNLQDGKPRFEIVDGENPVPILTRLSHPAGW